MHLHASSPHRGRYLIFQNNVLLKEPIDDYYRDGNLQIMRLR